MVSASAARDGVHLRARSPWCRLRQSHEERLFTKLEESRRVATRHEKLRETFPGMIQLALGFIRLRAITNVKRA